MRRTTIVTAAVAATLALGAAPDLALASVSTTGPTRPTLRVVGYGAAQQPAGNGGGIHYLNPEGGCSVLAIDDDGQTPPAHLVHPGLEQLRISLHVRKKPTRFTFVDYPTQSDFRNGRDTSSVSARLLRSGKRWQITAAQGLAAGASAYLALELYSKAPCGGSDSHGYIFHLAAANA